MDFPMEMRAVRGWVHERSNKIPLQPLEDSDIAASCTKNPEQLRRYEDIAELIKLKGVGYYPAVRAEAEDKLIFFDIDCHNGKNPEEAAKQFEECISVLGTEGIYAEKSVSGNGYHIVALGIGTGKLKAQNKDLQVEAWNHGQFMLMTGNALYNCEKLQDKTERIKQLLELYGLLSDDMKKAAKNLSKVKEVLTGPIFEGARNNAMFDFACSLAKTGSSGRKLFNAVMEKNEEVCVLPLEAKEIQGICERAEAYAPEKGKKQKLTYEMLENELIQMGITIYFNELTRKMEIEGNIGYFNPDTITQDLSMILYSRIGDDYTSASDSTIFGFLKIIAGMNRYHPVVDFFESNLPEDVNVNEELDKLYEILGVTVGLEKTLIAKWLIQCVAMVFNTNTEKPYGADGCLVLQGAQGIGKTKFASKLGMGMPGFVNVGVHLNDNDKDTYRRAVTAWITELGELDATFKKSDIERLKAFITQPRDQYRLPYDRTDLEYNRRTSFIATVNEDEFLVDTTGNRRFWTVHVSNIDLDALDRYDFKRLWAGIYELWQTEGEQSFRLSNEEQRDLAESNKKHEKPMKGWQEITDILAYTVNNADYYKDWVTASEIHNAYPELRTIHPNYIGRVLKKMNIDSKVLNGSPFRYFPMPRIWKR